MRIFIQLQGKKLKQQSVDIAKKPMDLSDGSLVHLYPVYTTMA
jgi:hypothetical protein